MPVGREYALRLLLEDLAGLLGYHNLQRTRFNAINGGGENDKASFFFLLCIESKFSGRAQTSRMSAPFPVFYLFFIPYQIQVLVALLSLVLYFWFVF